MIQRVALRVFACLFLTNAFVPAADLGTAFTYQGNLIKNGVAVTDTCDFRFGLWDAAAGGNQQGNSPQTVNVVPVTDGVFTTPIDFGAGAINGNARWIEVEVRCPTAVGGFSLLAPRVELTAAPHALALPGVFPDTATGNVGIGTTSPARKLDVTGIVRSSTGGFEFPDGTLLSSAAGISPLLSLAQIATLRWDSQQADFVVGTFAVGNRPGAMAFDGANIWVANADDGNVTKLRASDGANLGTFAVGINPGGGVAFDGANIWVANLVSGNVTKLRASDGANLGTFATGGGPNSGPNAVAFDGANIWVANINSNNVTKLRASDGANLGNFAVGSGPNGAAFDGANIWVSNFYNDNVTKLRASDGGNLGTFAVGDGPNRMAFDGANIWIPNVYSNNVTKLRASDGANLGTFAVGISPGQLAFDGTNIWITNALSDSVTKLRASDGANLGTFAVGDFPGYLAFDGANIWVTNTDDDTVTKIFVSDDVGLSQWQRIVGGIAYTGGEVGIGTTDPAYPLQVGIDATNGNGAHVTAGGVWTNGSDRNSKRNFEELDKQEILDRVAELPVTRWQYKSEPENVRHVGPVAQDFYAAFGTGEDQRYIGTIDADGVALVAIQGLYEVVKEKECEFEDMKAQNDRVISELADQNMQLGSKNAELEARLERLEALMAVSPRKE